MSKLYPVGVQNFEKVILGGYEYVDKTALIYELFNTGSYYFLSRPRRFGKSLLLSTLEAYAQGKKELFKGLALEKLERDWTVYPVLHMDLNTEKYDTKASLENKLELTLKQWEGEYGYNPDEYSVATRFEGVIRRACEQTGRRVVILIDEYDKPMLQAIGNEALQNEYRSTLKAFYGALKSMDGCIRFALLTGVTKFGKVSVFSDLNNLMDISMDDRYVEICGISEKEVHAYFEEDIHALATATGLTYEETCAELKANYDGYHFTENAVGMYNPFSLLNTFAKKKFGSYWFETGTPTYLVELLKLHHYPIEDLEHIVTSQPVLDSIDTASTDPIPVIYQSGYLTIKGYNKMFENYTLGFPNREVEQGFFKFLLPNYASVSVSKSPYQIQCFVEEVMAGKVDDFFDRLKTMFADIPYELARDREVHYQNILYIIFKLMGFYVQMEYHTSRGRIDLVLQTQDYVYVMEFKLNGSADEALAQIREKGYAAPFAKDSRTVYRIGVNFSDELRNIQEVKVEQEK